jgi:hypothetical protein
MNRRQFTAAPLGLVLTPALWVLMAERALALGESDAASGVRAALERAAGQAVSLLGRSDGFLGDARVRIALPPALERAGSTLRRLGQGRRVDELVTGMNRAAEQAVPLARPLLANAVRSMSVEDAVGLVRGGSDTAISDFFARKTREPLTTAFTPEVQKVTEQLALAKRHDDLVDRAARWAWSSPRRRGGFTSMSPKRRWTASSWWWPRKSASCAPIRWRPAAPSCGGFLHAECKPWGGRPRTVGVSGLAFVVTSFLASADLGFNQPFPRDRS